MFVLDEADEMLSRGFKDQIYDIFQKLNSNTQVRKAVRNWLEGHISHRNTGYWSWGKGAQAPSGGTCSEAQLSPSGGLVVGYHAFRCA